MGEEEKKLRDVLWTEALWGCDFYSSATGFAYRVEGIFSHLQSDYFSRRRRFLRRFHFDSIEHEYLCMDVVCVGQPMSHAVNVREPEYSQRQFVEDHLNDELAGSTEYAASRQKIRRVIYESLRIQGEKQFDAVGENRG